MCGAGRLLPCRPPVWPSVPGLCDSLASGQFIQYDPVYCYIIIHQSWALLQTFKLLRLARGPPFHRRRHRYPVSLASTYRGTVTDHWSCLVVVVQVIIVTYHQACLIDTYSAPATARRDCKYVFSTCTMGPRSLVLTGPVTNFDKDDAVGK